MSTGIGDTLRAAREEQGRDLHDAARVLRMRAAYLEALEEERFDAFGGDIYAKGFLRSYAQELGLDPEPLLETYRREVSSDEAGPAAIVSTGAATASSPRSAPPAWMAWAIVALAVLVGLGLIGYLGSRTPEQAALDDDDTPPAPVENDEDEANDDEEGDGDADADEPADDADDADGEDPEPEVIEGVELLLAFEQRSWVRVAIDGATVTEQVIEAGETQQFEGEEEIEIRFGNAGGVRVEYNGEPLGTPGSGGEVRTIIFTPDGAQDPDGQEF